MKKIIFATLSLLIFSMESCIKEAPKNPEADIESFKIPSNLSTAETVIDQANRRIYLYLTDEAYTKGVAPVITISKAGTVKPASGDSIHFNAGVTYKVTAENGTNIKEYLVEVVNVGNWTFNFETWKENPDDRYLFPLEPNGIELWSSGNPGVAFSGVDKTPDSYPTRSTSAGYLNTTAAELVTLKGNILSEFVGIKLFAGSLFVGTFNANEAFANPLAATEFGAPYVGKPKTFTGYYKYAPGANFQDKAGNVIAGQQDKCSIYAVLYSGTERLNATNIHTSDRVIATAILPDGSAKTNFTKFSIPFSFVANKPVTGKMMMTIVASSSSEGDQYRGAIGSKLVVDSLRIIPQ